MKHSGGSMARLVFLLALIGAALFVGMFWRRIADEIAVARYQPTAEIQAIAERAGLKDDGEFYFYASQPVLEGTQTFNKYCNRREEKSAILGCYANGKIYIYDVSDERLDGIEEVTAAHEMLHAAYERMSEADKSKLQPLLEAEYSKITDEELQERMAYYDRTEPGQHYNELHSIIATEVANISPELEEYFARYFENRAQVVALHADYRSEFEAIENKTSTLANELNDLANAINVATEQYNVASAQLNADIQTFNARAERGGYGSQAAFTADRSQLIARSNELSSKRQQIEYDIATYENKLKEYQALTSEAEELNNSIDSSLAPAPAV